MAASLSGCSRVKEWDADRFAFDGIRAKGQRKKKKETLGFPGLLSFFFVFLLRGRDTFGISKRPRQLVPLVESPSKRR